jgi:hypothetical protein
MTERTYGGELNMTCTVVAEVLEVMVRTGGGHGWLFFRHRLGSSRWCPSTEP